VCRYLLLGGMDYYNDADKLQILSDHINKNKYINHATTKIWFAEFKKWMKKKQMSTLNIDDVS